MSDIMVLACTALWMFLMCVTFVQVHRVRRYEALAEQFWQDGERAWSKARKSHIYATKEYDRAIRLHELTSDLLRQEKEVLG